MAVVGQNKRQKMSKSRKIGLEKAKRTLHITSKEDHAKTLQELHKEVADVDEDDSDEQEEQQTPRRTPLRRSCRTPTPSTIYRELMAEANRTPLPMGVPAPGPAHRSTRAKRRRRNAAATAPHSEDDVILLSDSDYDNEEGLVRTRQAKRMRRSSAAAAVAAMTAVLEQDADSDSELIEDEKEYVMESSDSSDDDDDDFNPPMQHTSARPGAMARSSAARGMWATEVEAL